MGLLSYLSHFAARKRMADIHRWMNHPEEIQQRTFQQLIEKGKDTLFGEEHYFDEIKSYEDFRERVPVRDYEQMIDYINLCLEGKENILWPGKPVYFAKTSGSVGGTKYIPLMEESVSYHIQGAKDTLLSYIYHTGKSQFLNGKMMFLSGSPKFDGYKGGIPVGRLSGIANHHVSWYLKRNQFPDFETNCIDDWEEKVEKIAKLSLKEDMCLMAGIPPWIQNYFDKLISLTGKKVGEIFPNLQLFIHGGVDYRPYMDSLNEDLGRKLDVIELYPASEGFIALQNDIRDSSLLLMCDYGIFYEFIRADEFFKENPKRISLKDVEPGVNYAIILSTNAGLWAYNIGDTVRFTSVKPYKLKVTGRLKHFISAFGEHVIAEEVDTAMQSACTQFGAGVTEFTVAPVIGNVGIYRDASLDSPPYHEWLVEFSRAPDSLQKFREALDKAMQRNPYYSDLRKWNILKPLKLTAVPKDTFIRFMKSEGKLGGQNKVPRLQNDRKMVEKIFRTIDF